MLNFDSLSDFTKNRLKDIYNAVREKICADEKDCNNWVKRQYFESETTGFPEFAESLAISVDNGEVSWYEEDETIINWCCSALRLADFLNSKN